MAKKKKTAKIATPKRSATPELEKEVRMHRKALINLTIAVNSIAKNIGMKMKLRDELP